MTVSRGIAHDLELDLAGLSAVAEPLLAKLPVSDQRIQAVPDARTLRFYQSTGLLDRPLRYDGRVAKYGRRHLLQVLAVRALQSRGLSLAQVQSVLSAATDEELEQTVESANLLVPLHPISDAKPLRVEPAAVNAVPVVAVPAVPGPFVAVELVPGLIVTIDTRLHSDPQRAIDRLRRAIQGDAP